MSRKGFDGGDEEGKNTVFCRLITRHILVIYTCAIHVRLTPPTGGLVASYKILYIFGTILFSTEY